MTRFPHDEFAKGFLESLLSPFGEVQTSFKISSEVREVYVYFQPDKSIQPIPQLGLLGKIAQTDFVVEPPVLSVAEVFGIHQQFFRFALVWGNYSTYLAI
jgi:hypothetical protein